MEIIRTFFHYFAEWIAFRFLYSEKGSLAKIDGMDNGDALLLALLIESKRGFVVMQGCIHRIPDALQVACIHIFHRQRILFYAIDMKSIFLPRAFMEVMAQGTGGYQASHVCTTNQQFYWVVHL